MFKGRGQTLLQRRHTDGQEDVKRCAASSVIRETETPKAGGDARHPLGRLQERREALGRMWTNWALRRYCWNRAGQWRVLQSATCDPAIVLPGGPKAGVHTELLHEHSRQHC